MKKIIFSLIICSIFFLIFTGCENKKDKEISVENLRNLYDEIISKNPSNYRNYASCNIDEDKKIIVVELIDNSKKEQEWFRKNIKDSKYIKFEQGGPYGTYKIDFYIAKSKIKKDTNFRNYYKNLDQTIYLINSIEEFYVIDNESEETLKEYINLLYSTIDDSIRNITNNLELVGTLNDGGTNIYKSQSKDVTIIECNRIDGHKDFYIGDYQINFKQDMCK